MNVPEVRLLGGGLRELLGGKSVEVAPGRVAGALDELVDRAGEPLAKLFFDEDGETLSRDLRVLVNGRSIQFLDGTDTELKAEDSLTLHLSGIRGYPGG